MVDRRRVISRTRSRINNHRRQGIGQDGRQADYQEADPSPKGREEGYEEVGPSQEADPSPKGREEGYEEVGPSQEADPSPKGREEGCEEAGSSSQASCQEGG
jgi:hypothetical protein